jgi:hypothetical protein
VKIERFVAHMPKIEERIAMARLDCIVMGLGPTAWLMPHMRQSLFAGLRFVGAHDAFSIRPVHDLVVMDHPVEWLNPDSERHMRIVDSRPERFWMYEPAERAWRQYLPDTLKQRMQLLRLHDWDGPKCTGLEPFKLEADPIHTISVSPTGCTTLAWKLGARRIGVIGVDMMPGHHHTSDLALQVDCFFTAIARQAFDAGGLILNLSPVTSLKRFALASQGMMHAEHAVTPW